MNWNPNQPWGQPPQQQQQQQWGQPPQQQQQQQQGGASWMDAICSGNADAASGGRYFLVGHYECSLKAVKSVPSFKGGQFFITEWTIEKSDNPEIPAGDTRSHSIPLQGNPAALNEAKAMAIMLANYVLKQNGQPTIGNDVAPAHLKQIIAALVSEAQPATGLRAYLDAWNKVRRDGGDFTKHDWTPLEPGQSMMPDQGFGGQPPSFGGPPQGQPPSFGQPQGQPPSFGQPQGQPPSFGPPPGAMPLHPPTAPPPGPVPPLNPPPGFSPNVPWPKG